MIRSSQTPPSVRATSALRRLYRLLSVVLLAHAAFTRAQTTPAREEEILRLPEFSVSADKADRYAPGDTISAARIRAPIIDTAASISVISLDFLKDIGSESVLDATRYIS